MASEKEAVSFPNESPEYRSSRDRLLQAEIELRRQLEDVRTTVTAPTHFYNTELLYAPSEPGQDGRHVDLIWPLWNLFDYTPEGRGTDWRPRLAYDSAV